MTNQAEIDLYHIDQALKRLSEHFDTVQIFATRHEASMEDGTVALQSGMGNWFARIGHVREWLIREDEATRTKQREKDEE